MCRQTEMRCGRYVPRARLKTCAAREPWFGIIGDAVSGNGGTAMCLSKQNPRACPRSINILDLVVGKPIKTSDERAEQIGPAQGIPIFGLDALSSAAYGPEAALNLLIPLGLLGIRYVIPISAAIITLLVIVYFSYRQTIAAYPSGGGSFTVARFNLGAPAGLLAAAALLADYILTTAVGISAGVGALVSAVPSL